MASAPSGDKRSSAADAGAAPRAPRPGAGDGSRDDLRIKRSGRYLASLMSVAEPLDAASARDAPMAALLDPRVRGAATEEMKHEIIGLGERLVVNEENLAALKSSVDPDAPALIVSFLGDTSAGKSHTIRQLMSASESRPFCQNARGQSMATTFNVNLFPCTSIAPGMVVHLVDYEGENGSNTPVMMAARSLVLREGSKVSRSEQVASHFPRLAYTTSDVIVMVAREPFYNRRYLDRCIQLAKRANSGVANVQRPALVLVGNKLPGDEVVLDVDASTTAFFDCWGDDAQELDSFFSAILCVYVPHKSSVWTDPDDPTRTLDGATACELQLGKLRNILAVLGRRRAEGKGLDPTEEDEDEDEDEEAGDGESGSEEDCEAAGAAHADSGASGGLGGKRRKGRSVALSQRHGVWFGLLPRVVEELNAGRGVDVGRLLDEAWQEATQGRASADEGAMDAFTMLASALRPARSLSSSSPAVGADVAERHRQHQHAALAVAGRVLACRLRALDRGLLVPDRIRSVVEETVACVRRYLDSIAPCCAVYDAPGTTAVDHPGQPVHCLQERRHHATHRTSGRVRGGAGLWGLVAAFIPFNDTWRGRHVPPSTDPVSIDAIADEVARLARMTETEFLEALASLRESLAETAPLVRLGLARLPVPAAYERSPALERVLLGPCEAVSPEAAARLAIIPGMVAPPNLPYCIGCGIKLTAQAIAAASPSAKAGSAAAAAAAAATASSGQSAPSGLLGAIASLFRALPTDMASPRGDSPATSDPSHAALPSAVAMASLAMDRPGVDAARHRDGTRGRAADGSGSSAPLDDDEGFEAMLAAVTARADPEDSSGAGEGSAEAAPGPPKQNVWLGLCPRCWEAAYAAPARRDVPDAKFVPLPEGLESVFD